MQHKKKCMSVQPRIRAMQHRGKHFTEDTLTHVTMAVSESRGF